MSQITLLLDLAARTVRLQQSTTIKSGGDVLLSLLCTAAPGSLSGISFALGSDENAPAILAFTEDFTQENATLWTAVLDATDTRLAAALDGIGQLATRGELITIIDGLREVWPSVAITVQPAFSAGPVSSQGGVSYVRLLTAITGYTGGGASNLDGLVTLGASYNVVQFVHTTEGLRSYQLVTGTDAEAAPGIIRPDDFHASTNPKVWKSI